MNQASSSSIKRIGSETKSAKSLTSLCLQCMQKILQSRELVDCLILEYSTFAFTPRNQRIDFSLFTCRVCDHADLHRDKMTEHVYRHFDSSEILFCTGCQNLANELMLGFTDESQESSVLYDALLSKRKGMIQCTLKHFDAIMIPRCGFCQRSFGYFIPIMNRIVQRLKSGRYECSICREVSRNVGSMLQHAQNHIQANELFCIDCINQYKLKEDVYSPTAKVGAKPKDARRNELSQSEYQHFKDQLLKSTTLHLPFPLPSSSSDSSAQPDPEPLDRQTPTKKERARDSRRTTSKLTNVLNFHFPKEVACFAWMTRPKARAVPSFEVTKFQRNSIFVCDACKKNLGGWAYAKDNILKIDKIKDKKGPGHFSCQICNFSSENWSPMESHILSHLEKKDVYCPECIKKHDEAKRSIWKLKRKK